MDQLSEEQLDALNEIINIGIGKAAGSLNEIMESHITLQVPELEILPLDGLSNVMNKFGKKSYSTVLQSFKGDYQGNAALIFPPESAVQMVSILTNEKIDTPTLDSVRSGALLEVGNIIINAILGTICGQLETSVDFMLPEYHEGDILRLITLKQPSGQAGIIMLAEAQFHLEELEINGSILIIFELDSINSLIAMIEKSISK